MEAKKLLIAAAVDIAKEYYVSLTLDRARGTPIVIASAEGGMEIEEVARKNPDAILKEPLHPHLGLLPFAGLKIARKLGFAGKQAGAVGKLLVNLSKLYFQHDCSLVEINPLVVTKAGEVLALDAKVQFDDNALFRHADLAALKDDAETDPLEVAAQKANLNYIKLDGQIGCLVNGAGLAMATMDIIQYAGGKPANFLDVGGGASKEQVFSAFQIILGDKNVEGILVNIFGGIMDCNIIATGIVEAAREIGLKIPLVVRLEGNNVEAGKKTLADSGLSLVSGDNILDAAQKIVAEVKKAA